MAIACGLLAFASASVQASPSNKLRVLFIGNSLTTGSFLAACVIFVKLYGLTALEIPAKFETQAAVVKLPLAQIAILKNAVDKATKN